MNIIGIKKRDIKRRYSLKSNEVINGINKENIGRGTVICAISLSRFIIISRLIQSW